ncbi:MAG: 1-(5-phosphoribosyl)-5-amino-4-imidazole-carboxylate carboxylase, partial [Candidatus Methylomirabilia bacterium]
MDRTRLSRLLEDVAAGRLSTEEALRRLRSLPYEDLRFAKVDLHRALRGGAPEAVLCQGKTPEQVAAILSRLAESHDNVMATRASTEIARAVEEARLSSLYYPEARIVVVNPKPPQGVGLIAVVSAGTSDQPVAEEAAVSAEVLGNRVERVYDCG